ncbi:hypothetical protein [Dokdonella immobilis]|uniref:LTXXQ motif family protein n=1 Tax=Dokdonella immobilis TaxID=578942 RepID=A0A1I4X717_9GAMM|nr:hypothetical protein [Dokdonella immobilis]SFN21687.1 hypothetical protein SAMN05216289_10841 [Dokdonella immobilis]
MRIHYRLVLGLSLSLALALPALADQQGNAGGQGQDKAAATNAKQDGTTQQTPVTDANQVYGWQLMTPEERDAFRQQMRSMKTDQEREALRLQHHEQMKKRAAERGVTLPEMPMHRGGGMGPGAGMGPRGQPQQPPPPKDEGGG